MADNDNDDDEENVTKVETKIERLKSYNPKERLFRVTFDKFEDLPSEKGHAVDSSTEFCCFGSQWLISINPGGHEDSSDGMVGLYLARRSEGKKLAIKYSLALDYNDGEDQIVRRDKHVFDGNDSYGWHDYYNREDIIGNGDGDDGLLLKGGLAVRVSMQLDEFIPQNPASSFVLKLFDDEKSADVVFEICDQQKQSETEKPRKRAKTSTAKLYHAHRLILQHHSQELSALCATSDGMNPIIINNVKPEVFRHLLYYVYGGEISDDDFVGHERDIINAADKYGVTNLKLEAEVWYVNNTDITIDNVIDNLLYAHAMNCARLKETVMDFIVKNKETVMQQEQVSFQDVPGDVIKELLAAMSRHNEENGCSRDNKEEDDDNNDENKMDAEKTYSLMRIRDLRQKLHDKGLDIDGSREALIAKLKEHS